MEDIGRVRLEDCNSVDSFEEGVLRKEVGDGAEVVSRLEGGGSGMPVAWLAGHGSEALGHTAWTSLREEARHGQGLRLACATAKWFEAEDGLSEV